jgi:hypothetical protein
VGGVDATGILPGATPPSCTHSSQREYAVLRTHGTRANGPSRQRITWPTVISLAGFANWYRPVDPCACEEFRAASSRAVTSHCRAARERRVGPCVTHDLWVLMSTRDDCGRGCRIQRRGPCPRHNPESARGRAAPGRQAGPGGPDARLRRRRTDGLRAVLAADRTGRALRGRGDRTAAPHDAALIWSVHIRTGTSLPAAQRADRQQ